MIDRKVRAVALGFLASTALGTPAFAQNVPPETATQPRTTGQSPAPNTNATDVTAPPKSVQVAQQGRVQDQTEIIITATKREENLQNVPISVQVLGTRKLDQLNITNFEEYTKQLPSVTFSTAQPGFTTVYMRGIATGGDDSNHSGSLPTVGTYLDEQPITTIDGTLDVHIYDIARIESLSGPQGTLFGASSEAGTIRIITNKPELGVTTGRVDAEVNTVDHGRQGGKLEGMINVPIADRIAFRAVGFYQHDAGYIDNVFGAVTLCGDPTFGDDGAINGCIHNGIHFDNAKFVKKDFNDLTTYGGRAALKIDLDDNWTVLPQFMYQKAVAHGVFFEDADLGDLQTQRFQPEIAKDRFWQAALTIEGKIANFFDVTYAGAYMDRPRFTTSDYTDYTVAYDNSYESYGGIANYFYYRDNAGNVINPRQHIVGTDHFTKLSQELRVATPADRPIRALFGAFYQKQKNHIFQDYLVDGLATDLSVPGYPNTLWLTNQLRQDRDYALFGEANWDITHTITLTAGLRFYRFDNTLFGFAGFAKNPAFSEDQEGPLPAPNPAFGSSGVRRCLTVNGLELIDDEGSPFAVGNSGLNIPCYNVANPGPNGTAVPRRSKGSGHIPRLNIQWKPEENLMFYATWSKGFRPGGINRQPELGGYGPDFLTNYEAGWKTSFLGSRLTWDGAIYHERWSSFQFGFLGPNSLTIVQNGRDAKVNGIESQVNYVAGGLSLTAAAAYTDAKTIGNICAAPIDVDPSPDCTGLKTNGKPDIIVAPSGTRLAITPKFKASGTARYSWPMGQGKAHVQGAISYQTSGRSELRVADADLIGDIPSSTLVDLFLGYDWKRYSAELFATNVFDERNQLSRFVVCGACTQVHIVPGRPRTIGLRLGAHW
jgi:outer membrane receptor protein involved in Fe transport